MSSRTANIKKIQIKDYPKYYVNRDGDVFSTWKGKMNKLSAYKDKSGYPGVRLFKESKEGKMFRVHRIVADTFLGHEPGKQIDHIDGDKANNNVDNLRWVTQKENLLKKYREDGHKIHFSIPIKQYSLDGKFIDRYPSILDAVKSLGKKNSGWLTECCRLNKPAYGFIWKYE